MKSMRDWKDDQCPVEEDFYGWEWFGAGVVIGLLILVTVWEMVYPT